MSVPYSWIDFAQASALIATGVQQVVEHPAAYDFILIAGGTVTLFPGDRDHGDSWAFRDHAR